MNQKTIMTLVKKIAQNVDNSSNYSEKRYKMICQIQQLLKEGCSYREIARRMGVGRNTIAKYRTGDPKELSMYGMHQSKLDIFHNFILECLYSGKSKSKTVKAVYANGYTGSKSNAFDYLVKIEQREGKTFEPQPYIRTQTEALKYRMGSKGKTADYITREGVFKHMWMDVSLTDLHKSYIYRQFPNLWDCMYALGSFGILPAVPTDWWSASMVPHLLPFRISVAYFPFPGKRPRVLPVLPAEFCNFR